MALKQEGLCLCLFLSFGYNRFENSQSRVHNGTTSTSVSALFHEPPILGSRLSSAATQSAFHQFPELVARHRRVMRGDLEQLLNAKAKIIRVFTSSTFTGKRLVIRKFSYSKLWILDSGFPFLDSRFPLSGFRLQE